MAEQALAKTSLIMGTDATGLYSGLSAASAKVSGWAKSVGSTLSGAFKNSAFSSLGKGLGGGLSSLTGGWAGILKAGLGLGKDFIGESIAKIKELGMVGMQAEGLGLLSEDFMSLSIQAKKFNIESGDLAKTLTKFNAATADKNVLGLDLDGKDLMTKFEAVATKIQSIPDAAHQAAAAIEAFGKAGPAMLPLLQQGAEGIEKFKKRQMELGNAVGQADMERVMMAMKAIPKIGEVFDGFKQKITVALAPLIMVFASVFERIMPLVQTVVGFAADVYSNYLRGMATLWEFVFTMGGELITQVIDMVKSWGSLSSEIPSMATVFDKVFRFIGKVVAYTFDTIKAGLGGVLFAVGKLTQGVGAVATALGLDWGEKFTAAGASMTNLGKTWVNAFGESAGKVDKFFDMVAKRNDEMGKKSIATAHAVSSEYHAIGSIIQGSREGLSLEARFKTGNLLNPQVQLGQQQLAQQKEQVNELKKVNQQLEVIKAKPAVELEEV